MEAFTASLTFARGIHRSPVNSPHKWPVMRTLRFLWYSSAHAVKQTVEWPVIWDYMTFMWRIVMTFCGTTRDHKLGIILTVGFQWELEVDADISYQIITWRHDDHDGVSNHQPLGCLLNLLFRRKIKENIKAQRPWPLCGEFTGAGEFPAQKASYAENVSIWWRRHVLLSIWYCHWYGQGKYLVKRQLLYVKPCAISNCLGMH